jgi:quercetin dioxygenase-like cupin family protein
MGFFNVRELPKKKVSAGISVASVKLDNVMVTYFEFEQGKTIPLHSHPHEQITLILEGEMQFIMGAQTKRIGAGEGVTVPPQVSHSAVALTPVVAIDAWHPIREDYIVPSSSSRNFPGSRTQ